MDFQRELWPEEIVRPIIRGYRLFGHLLETGEKPDTRPWAGLFDTLHDRYQTVTQKGGKP